MTIAARSRASPRGHGDGAVDRESRSRARGGDRGAPGLARGRRPTAAVATATVAACRHEIRSRAPAHARHALLRRRVTRAARRGGEARVGGAYARRRWRAGHADELGPIVVSKDGKLGHLSNWHEMTESEQAAALKFVAARNAKRRAALLKIAAARSPPTSCRPCSPPRSCAPRCRSPARPSGRRPSAPRERRAARVPAAARAGRERLRVVEPEGAAEPVAAPLRHGSLDREGAYRRLRSQLLASDGVALIDEDGGAYLRARYAEGDDAEYRVTDDAVSFRVVASKPTKAKPFCAQVGCVNGNEAQRRRKGCCSCATSWAGARSTPSTRRRSGGCRSFCTSFLAYFLSRHSAMARMCLGPTPQQRRRRSRRSPPHSVACER